MANIHERQRDIVEEQMEIVENLDIGEERTNEVENLKKLYEVLLKKDKDDEDILDRRSKMETDEKIEEKKLHRIGMDTLIAFTAVLGSSVVGIAAENAGLIASKIPKDVLRVVTFRRK